MRQGFTCLLIILGLLAPFAQAQTREAQTREAQVRNAPFKAAAGNLAPSVSKSGGFEAWRRRFRAYAVKNGIRGDVFDSAYAGVAPKPKILELDAFQPEFTKTLWDYLDSAVTRDRVRAGTRAARKWRTALGNIERAYGVDQRVLLGIWGMETNFGGFMGGTGVIEGLSTLAFEGRRRGWAERELLAALLILQEGETKPDNLEGSWAGAMGHTQFMPTSFLAYAVDFDGDGRRDVWSDNPTDALASTANYLKVYGYKMGQPWGREVMLPPGFDYGLANIEPGMPVSFWNAKGVRQMDGALIPNYGRAGLWTPGGYGGPAFVVFDNFFVIQRYNRAKPYVTAVGHLGDRIFGADAFKASWPKDNRPLNRAETRLLQERLTAKGYDTQGVDGLIGPNSIAAIRAFQRAQGMVPDGNATLAVLKRLQ